MMTEYDRGYVAGLSKMRDILLGTGHDVIEHGPLLYDRRDDMVSIHGRRVRFPTSHRRLIELLLTGRLVTTDNAITVVWPMGTDDIETPDNIIKVHICNLRKRLCKLGAPKDLILTEWGKGHRLNKLAVWASPPAEQLNRACREVMPAVLAHRASQWSK